MNDTTIDKAAVGNEAQQDEGVLREEAAVAEKKKKTGKETGVKALIRILITLVIIALGIFLILFLVAKAGRFDSIGSMLQHMWVELSLMWQRILS